jgi:hypothetical protein
MQLLDLVEVLITDHRTSLLERKRLQQQLDSVQQALHVERLDEERAAALADIRWGRQLSTTKSPIAAAHSCQEACNRASCWVIHHTSSSSTVC